MNFSFYNNKNYTRYYQVLTYNKNYDKTNTILCNTKSVLDVESLFLICARIHSTDNYELKVQKYPIVGTAPKLYIDYSNKKVYVNVNAYTNVSFLVFCGKDDTFVFNDGITIDSVEGLEML